MKKLYHVLSTPVCSILVFMNVSHQKHHKGPVYNVSFHIFCCSDRIDPFVFKFQFKNVEYSSGRNKTFLCYLVDKGKAVDGLLRGYLEDEHTGGHAEEAFFTQCLPDYDPALKYTVTWYGP